MQTVNELLEEISAPDMVWYFEDTNRMYKHPITVKEIVGEMKADEVEGNIGGYVFTANDRSFSLQLEQGLRCISCPAVAVKCSDGYVVFYN